MFKWILEKIKILAGITMTVTGITIPGESNAEIHFIIFFTSLAIIFVIMLIEDDDVLK